MNELSTQAANDTNTSVDRAAIQAEIDQLTIELDRVASTTNFNAEIYPLKGGYKVPDSIISNTVTVVNNSGYDITFNGRTYTNGTTFNVDGVLCLTDGLNTNNAIYYKKADGGGSGGVMGNTFTIPACTSQPELYLYTVEDVKINENGYIYYDWDENGIASQRSRMFACDHQFLSILSGGHTGYALDNPTEEQLVAAGARKADGFNADINLQVGALAH